jgi:hypothetical protein
LRLLAHLLRSEDTRARERALDDVVDVFEAARGIGLDPPIELVLAAQEMTMPKPRFSTLTPSDLARAARLWLRDELDIAFLSELIDIGRSEELAFPELDDVAKWRALGDHHAAVVATLEAESDDPDELSREQRLVMRITDWLLHDDDPRPGEWTDDELMWAVGELRGVVEAEFGAEA